MGVAQVLLRGSVEYAICVVLGEKPTLGKIRDRLPVRDLERAPGGFFEGERTRQRIPSGGEYRTDLICKASAGPGSPGSARQGVEPLLQALALGGTEQRASEGARKGALSEEQRGIE